MSDAVIFLQNLPTKGWTDTDLEMLLQEAYVFQETYERSNHLKQNNSSVHTNRSSII